QLHRVVAELAGLRRLDADLALLVDDGLVVGLDRGVQGEDRPPILDRVHGGQVVEDVLAAGLRLEGVAEQLRVAVEQPLSGVATVLVHRGDHNEAKVLGRHGSSLNTKPGGRSSLPRSVAGRTAPGYGKPTGNAGTVYSHGLSY